MICKKIVILGAGLSGLTSALKLCEKGYDVSIYEERDIVGGQALSINYNGAIFDLGPHGWHTLFEDLNSFFFNICSKEKINIFPKKAGIFFNESLLDYPLKIKNLLTCLPTHKVFISVVKYFTRPKTKTVSAEDFFISMYGVKLYEMFFEKYTEHVWGIHPSEISSSFFYKRVPRLSLINLFVRTMSGSLFLRKAKKDDDPGYAYEIKGAYPERGLGIFAESMADLIRELGGEIYLSSPVVGVNHNCEKIKSIVIKTKDIVQEVECDYCTSSIPITTLINSLNPQIETMSLIGNSFYYRAIIIVCLIIRREHISDYQTIYFHNNIFNRIGIMNNFSSSTCPPGRTCITVELTCFEDDETWNAEPGKLKDSVVSELVKLDFFNKEDVEDYTIIKEKYGYPVLKVGDPEKLEEIFNCLNSFSNLSIIGRQGRFDYIQMADAVREGMNSSKQVMEHFK